MGRRHATEDRNSNFPALCSGAAHSGYPVKFRRRSSLERSSLSGSAGWADGWGGLLPECKLPGDPRYPPEANGVDREPGQS